MRKLRLKVTRLTEDCKNAAPGKVPPSLSLEGQRCRVGWELFVLDRVGHDRWGTATDKQPNLTRFLGRSSEDRALRKTRAASLLTPQQCGSGE